MYILSIPNNLELGMENEYLKGAINACDMLSPVSDTDFTSSVKIVTGMTDGGLEKCEFYQSLMLTRAARYA